jgi:NAD(P)H-nitrite reductase large subunit
MKPFSPDLTDINLADNIICPCSGTTRGEIAHLFAQGKDIDAISRWTGAVSGCGGCEWDIAEMLKALAEAQNKN